MGFTLSQAALSGVIDETVFQAVHSLCAPQLRAGTVIHTCQPAAHT
ncbi:MAG: hypothetical protein ABI564_16175 [Ideonella sp.]